MMQETKTNREVLRDKMPHENRDTKLPALSTEAILEGDQSAQPLLNF